MLIHPPGLSVGSIARSMGATIESMKDDLRDPGTSVATLANGVRVIAMQLPHVETVGVSVFVRSGSQHESARLNGISHVVEHMAFKGTRERDCQQINLDAERLGADVNAHTDKDHTAFQMSGLGRDAGHFVEMLADIVRNCTFPEAELERERQVILHEYLEDEDDALSTAYKLYDKTCFGAHPIGQPVIGTRRNIQRFTRADLLEYVQRQYTGANTIVGIAGAIDPEAMLRAAEAAFADVPAASRMRSQRRLHRRHRIAPAKRLQPDPRRARLPDSVAARRRPGGNRRGRAVRRRHELAADGPDPRASRTRLLRRLHGRGAGAVRAVRDRGDDRAGTPRRTVRRGHAPARGAGRARRSGRARTGPQPDRGAPAARPRTAAAAPRGCGAGPVRAGPDPAAPELMARIHDIDAGRLRTAFARLLAMPPAIAIAGKIPKGVNERVLEIIGGRPPRHRRAGAPRNAHASLTVVRVLAAAASPPGTSLRQRRPGGQRP
jgi:hypothetical protein